MTASPAMSGISTSLTSSRGVLPRQRVKGQIPISKIKGPKIKALDQAKSEQRALRKLREQVEENRAALRERFLLKLVTGAATSAEAIEKSQLLGIDLVARCSRRDPQGRTV